MRWIVFVGAIAIMAGLGAPAINASSKTFLWNDSPSEPKGVYVKVIDPPRVGEIVAFMAPPPAFPYANRRLGYLHQIPILKALAAGQGAQVCAQNGVLKISGKVVAAVMATDSQGAPLPHWDGCRSLAVGEFFAFSDRVPNSFDSRYFGPIDGRRIFAAYRPLWVGGPLKS